MAHTPPFPVWLAGPTIHAPRYVTDPIRQMTYGPKSYMPGIYWPRHSRCQERSQMGGLQGRSHSRIGSSSPPVSVRCLPHRRLWHATENMPLTFLVEEDSYVELSLRSLDGVEPVGAHARGSRSRSHHRTS